MCVIQSSLDVNCRIRPGSPPLLGQSPISIVSFGSPCRFEIDLHWFVEHRADSASDCLHAADSERPADYDSNHLTRSLRVERAARISGRLESGPNGYTIKRYLPLNIICRIISSAYFSRLLLLYSADRCAGHLANVRRCICSMNW